MPHWLSITLVVFCWIYALQQIRMMLIYLGLMPHPFIPQGSHLAKIAIRSAINFSIYGFIVLLIPWPRLLTYLFSFVVCMTVIDAVFGMLGIGKFGNMIESKFNLKRQVVYLASKIIVFGLIAWVCFYFFGF